jgi:TonB family protein
MIRKILALGLLAGLALGTSARLADAAAGQTLVTSYTVLVGFPSGEDAATAGVLLVPGTVIPVEPDEEPEGLAEQPDVVTESLAFARVVEKLWKTFRLDTLRRLQKGRYVEAAVSQSVELPAPPDADVHLSAALMGFSDTVATYRVVFRQGEQVLADSTVNVNRGSRAVVGGMNGESAPYIFVIVEPDPPRSRPVPFDKQAGIAEPVIVHKTRPAYPKSAKEEGVQGIVLVTAVLDEQGQPRDVRILHSPDPRLSEAAMEAARQWRWEPARTRDGTPIAVYFTLTFNFRLQ